MPDPITLWTVVTQINEVLGVYETLKSFVYDEMAELMARMGETEFKAAIESLRDIKTIDTRLSETKRDELRNIYTSNAILALKTAREKFEASVPKGIRRWTWNHDAACEMYARICNALVLEATCFGALGDQTNAATRFEKAVEVFEDYAREAIKAEEASIRFSRASDMTPKGSLFPSKDRQDAEEALLREREYLDTQRKKLKELEVKARS